MMGSTREIVDARGAACDDEGSAPDERDVAVVKGDRRVTVVLIDRGDVVVDALDWF